MADLTSDRVEAAFVVASNYIADKGIIGTLYPAIAAALVAADECDRVAGVVRVDTNDNKTGRVIYDVLRMANESAYNTTLDAIARRILVALAAAGVGEQQGGQT